MTYYITVINTKGGTGKTTTAVSLAGALALSNYKVLAIDLDPHSGLTQSFSIPKTKNTKTIANFLMAKENSNSVILNTSFPGISVIPANNSLAEMEHKIHNQPSCHQLFRRFLKPACQVYDVVIFDCSPTLDCAAINALCISNLAIIPTQAHYLSVIAAIKNAERNILKIRDRYNSSLNLRFLITMFDKRSKIQITLLNRMQQEIGPRLFSTIIGIDSKIMESQMLGMPISHCHPNSRSAQQYLSLAEEIKQWLTKK